MNSNNSIKSSQANHWSRYIFQRGLINQLENKSSFLVFHGPGGQGNLPKEEDKQEHTAGIRAETIQSTYAQNKKDIGSLCAHKTKMSFQLISNKSFLNLLLKIEQSFCFLGIFHGPTLVSPFSFSNTKNTKSSKSHFFGKFTEVESQDWFTSFQEKRICLGWVDLPFFYHNLEVSTFVVLPPLVDQQMSCLQKNFISAA
jgi:hypothetical protein